MKTLKTLLLVALVTAFSFSQAYSQKITADEIIAKHLDSIGSDSERAQVRNILVKGDVKRTLHWHGAYHSDGKAIFASETNKAIFRIAVSAPAEYKIPGAVEKENIVFDGNDVQIGFPEASLPSRQGAIPIRSDFEEFINQSDLMVKDGLLGGILFANWNLANRAAEKGKLEFDGTDSAGGEKYYVLKFDPKNGSTVKVRMFFDMTTFQHKRTEYYLTLHGSLTTLGAASGQAGQPESLANYMKFTESFSDFRKEGQLTLPHKYTIFVKAPVLFDRECEYTLELKEFLFNVPFDPASFNVVKKTK